jgi:hypothetical protein
MNLKRILKLVFISSLQILSSSCSYAPTPITTLASISFYSADQSFYASLECPPADIGTDNCNLPYYPNSILEDDDAIAVRDAHGLSSGDIVNVTVMPTSFKVNFLVFQNPSSREIFTGTPIPHKSVAYLLRICNKTMPFPTPDVFAPIWRNMQAMYETCSRGRVSWDPKDNVVLGPVDIPCQGNYSRGPFVYNFTYAKCGSREQVGWVFEAEKHARSIADANLARVLATPRSRRILLILPTGSACGWAGLANIGCASPTCTAYINGNSAKNPRVIFHEMEHNNGLNHATTGTNEYGDLSDPMGDPGPKPRKAILCHNAPFSYRLGWAEPLATLTLTDFPDGATSRNFTIPSMAHASKNFITVNLGRTTTPSPLEGLPPITQIVTSLPTYYISYRVRTPTYDSGLERLYSNRVHVHIYNGTQTDRDSNKTQFISMFATNTTFRPIGRNSNLTIAVISTNTTHSHITLTRV